MGRNKKYFTEEDKIIAHREKQKRYYEKNKDKLNAQRMERYYKTKTEGKDE